MENWHLGFCMATAFGFELREAWVGWTWVASALQEVFLLH
jgi:hypothetical protein